MKTIKLLLAADPNFEKDALTRRLTEYLKNLRKTRLAKELIGDDEHSVDLGGDDFEKVATELSDGVALTWDDKWRIKKRVQRILQLRTEASGLGHLSEEEIQRLRPLMNEVRLVEPRDEHWVDETVSALHAEMPWMAAATNEVWRALRQNASSKDTIRLPPLLLSGPPGIGKSAWARRLSELLEIPRCEIDASLGGVGFSVAGTERGWSSAQPGRPLETILQHRVGNPLMVVDEICKAQSGTSDRGAHHAFSDSLLSFLEPATAVAWECPCYRTKFDMSHISWILTANDVSRVPEPLVNRCTVIELRALTCQQLRGFARHEAARMELSEASLDAIERVIEHSMDERGHSLSLRNVIRMLHRAVALESRATHH
ncbi:AAA family ATPase [Leisingera caerulea]|uniref:AAA family ATPase n=1 Tax=Leisingera caerulea TaxID=506591 RepID=A0A9Q9HM46_LEICA|nr:AAA family ATPase [Leisingera caerulea]UWQ54720.1 AAA family ATPase [Leisingera caerulea]